MDFRSQQTIERQRKSELTAIRALWEGNVCGHIKYKIVWQRLNRIYLLPPPDLISPEEKEELLNLLHQVCIEEKKTFNSSTQCVKCEECRSGRLSKEANMRALVAIRVVIDGALTIPVAVQRV